MEKAITLPAGVDKLPMIKDIVRGAMMESGGDAAIIRQVESAVEKIDMNVANYAYQGKQGVITVQITVTEPPQTAVVSFEDYGEPYDPLQSVPELRDELDDASYQRKGDKNVTVIKKIMMK